MPGESEGVGEQGLTGERGPTGDHGQAGDDGDAGLEGARGPMGLSGSPAPRRPLAVTVLLLITVLCGLTIVGAALWVAVDASMDKDRLVADRDVTRAENRALQTAVDMLREEAEQERLVDACALLYEQGTKDGRAHIVANVWHLFAALADEAPEEQLHEMVRDGDRAARELEAALAARIGWVADGRPLPCPLDPEVIE